MYQYKTKIMNYEFISEDWHEKNPACVSCCF